MLDPEDKNVFEITAEHLLHQADENENGKISRPELLRNYHVMLNSQLSDHGELWHDEL